jgi:CBS domain-containing protein
MKTAFDIMTPDPACCTPDTPLETVAKSMVQHNCGEIPVVDAEGELVAVVTYRDIVCRVLATGKNPLDHTVQACMSQPAIAVHPDATVADVIATWSAIRSVACPWGTIRSGASASSRRPISGGPGRRKDVAGLVREVSRN